VNNAKTMGLTDYGLRIGAKASLVVLDASNPIEALRLRAARLYVVANGRVISQTPRADATLSLPARPKSSRRRHSPDTT
ncbi:cytosine deaminase, partial [bacterium]|nr:cytosine deaminase [bacterium]